MKLVVTCSCHQGEVKGQFLGHSQPSSKTKRPSHWDDSAFAVPMFAPPQACGIRGDRLFFQPQPIQPIARNDSPPRGDTLNMPQLHRQALLSVQISIVHPLLFQKVFRFWLLGIVPKFAPGSTLYCRFARCASRGAPNKDRAHDGSGPSRPWSRLQK